jgi:hypothetical protein
MIILLFKNVKFWLVVALAILIAALIPSMPKDTFMVALTVIGVLFGGALTGAAVVTSLINEEGLRKIYERKKENYIQLIETMRASLAVLLFSLAVVVFLFFLPFEQSTLRFDGNQLMVVIPVWRLFVCIISLGIALSLFAAWEVVDAVIGMSRIRFELAGSRNQPDKRAENG